MMTLFVALAPHAYTLLKERRYMTAVCSALASLTAVVSFCAISDAQRRGLWILLVFLLGVALWLASRFDVDPEKKRLLEYFTRLDEQSSSLLKSATEKRSFVFIVNESVYLEDAVLKTRTKISIDHTLVQSLYAFGLLVKIREDKREIEDRHMKRKYRLSEEVFEPSSDAFRLVKLVKKRG